MKRRNFKYILTITLTLISIISCSQDKTSKNLKNQQLSDRIKYVNKPNDKDTLCISEINRAKKDIAEGKIVFTQSFAFGSSELRYENELKQICKEYGLEFGLDLISCTVIEGQTQGCYGDYMDKIIIEKFGINFKERLHKKADSLFLVNIKSHNKVVKYWDCDARPELINKEGITGDNLPSIKVSDLKIVKNKSDYGGYPFFDLGFIVEKDSTISNFHINNWVPHLNQNEKFKDKLYEIAVTHIKNKYPKWIPGRISETPVRTDNNVRVHFVKE